MNRIPHIIIITIIVLLGSLSTLAQIEIVDIQHNTTEEACDGSITVRAEGSAGPFEITLMKDGRDVDRFVDVHVYEVCETDDDILVHSGPTLSETDVCVMDGGDGSLDISNMQRIPKDPVTRKYLDSVEFILLPDNETLVGVEILAGKNKICDITSVIPHDTVCPNSQTNIQLAITNANTIFNNVGIRLKNNSISTKLYTNFDVNVDDLRKPNKLNRTEAKWLHYNHFSQTTKGANLLIVPDMTKRTNGDIVKGRAAINGENTLFLNATLNHDMGHTLAHELGHSVYNQLHPYDIDIHDRICDHKNFMYYTQNSGPSFACGAKTRLMLFRKYQWIAIHGSPFNN